MVDYYMKSAISLILNIFSTIKNYIKCVICVWNLPGPTTLPILGNTFLLRQKTEFLVTISKFYEKYGGLCSFWISMLPAVIIMEPKHLKVILSTTKNNEKNSFYKLMHNFIGRGLITNTGDKWKRNRRLIQPYFHINYLEKYIDVLAECAQKFSAKLEKQKTVKITPLVNELVLDILHNEILGVPLDKNSPYNKGQVQIIDRVIKPWLIIESIFKWTSSANQENEQTENLYSYTKQIMLERKKNKSNYDVNRKPCLLDIFIEIEEKHPEFTEQDIINEAVTFMLAGQDSSGATLSFILYYLAKYPEVQKKVHKEILTINIKNTLTIKEIHEMKYLEQVIKEVMRLAPVLPGFGRVLTEDVTLDGTKLPAGMNVIISPYITHRLKHIFPDPTKFDPDRFSESNVENIHPYAFLTFSLGPRNCIGYKFAMIELKTVLFYFLRKYEITLPPGKEEIIFAYRLTLRAHGGVWLNLNPRK